MVFCLFVCLFVCVCVCDDGRGFERGQGSCGSSVHSMATEGYDRGAPGQGCRVGAPGVWSGWGGTGVDGATPSASGWEGVVAHRV